MKPVIPKFNSSQRAFSLLETVSVAILLSIIVVIAIPIINKTNMATRQTKLTQDVRVLNSAVAGYIASGGKLNGLMTADQIINELKYSVAVADRETHVGFTGATIDLRLATRRMDDVSYKPSKVALWDQKESRFILAEASSNESGIVEFVLDETIDIAQFSNGKTRDTLMTYNGGEGWVWEYSEPNRPPAEGPTLLEVSLPSFVPEGPSGPTVSINETTTIVPTIGLNSANNAGFEDFVDKSQAERVFGGRGRGAPNAYYIDQSEVPGWNTTASDGLIEIWESGFSGVTANSGDQFIEFNATEVSTLYQEVNTEGAQSVKVSFAHGQRSRSTEQLRLFVGRSEPLRKTDPDQTEDLASQGFELVAETNSDRVKGWTTYELEYEFTDEAPTLYFAFQSFGDFSSRSIGNFLDDVSFQAVRGIQISGLDIDLAQGTSTSNIVESAKITLVGGQAGDQLSITGEIPDYLSYSVNTNSDDQMVLTINGDAFRWEYEEVLSQVTFFTDSDDTTSPRSLVFRVNDGIVISDPVEHELSF